MNIKNIWMAGFHIGFNEKDDYKDEILFENWLNNYNENFFNIDIAIEDKGNCRRQILK